MFLQEEYFQRHSIEIPLIKYAPRSVVFFKADNEWNIMDISWEECNYHPGKYRIVYYGPSYDCNGDIFNKLTGSDYCYWDEYEDFINLWVENLSQLNLEIQDTEIKCRLFAWEMFLHVFDGWVAKNISQTDLLYRSTSRNFDLYERLDAYNKLSSELSYNDGFNERLSIFKNKLKIFNRSYAFWLARIFNEKIHSRTS